MKDIQIVIAATTSVILFVFGLENFSKELQKITGERFRKFLAKATNYSGVGVLIGAFVTALIQSSSATSIIAISLVNAGVLSFKNSVSIIFGSNIGTTVTAQLVAFKLTAFAPAFIIAGFILSFIKSKYSVFAKSLFYFGFVFFSLNLISTTLEPLKNDSRVIEFLTNPQGIIFGVLIGSIVTAILQSSSVTTGLAVIFTQQGLLSLDNAIPILMGANIGTTFTALLSIINMDIAAKKTALAHVLFNVGGVCIFLPIVYFWRHKLPLMSHNPAIALANFHLIFNVTTSLVFLIALRPFTRLIDKFLGEGKMDFERLDLSFLKGSENASETAQLLKANLNKIFIFVQENYNLVTLSIETNYKGVYDASKKRVEYLDYLKTEFFSFVSQYIGETNEEGPLKDIIHVVNLYDYIFQIHDSVKDIIKVKDSMDQNYIDMQSDILMMLRELTSKTLSLFAYISKDQYETEDKEKQFKKESAYLQEEIDNFNRDILKLMSLQDRRDAGIIFHISTYSQRLKDKLVNYFHILKESDEIN